jgi:hypothetical protein
MESCFTQKKLVADIVFTFFLLKLVCLLGRPSSGLAMRCIDGNAAAPGLAKASCASFGGHGFDLLGMAAVCLSLGYKISGVR